jgi:peptidoglycan/xylan/chitin deacetylase (PgdA/CDA1 family)
MQEARMNNPSRGRRLNRFHFTPWQRFLMPALMCLFLFISGCQSAAVQRAVVPAPVPHPARFLLTFDDGPSLARPYNPTTAILDQLADNAVQPRIKALFFVQTRSPSAGGAPYGQELLRRIRDEGHVIGLHSGSARGHKNHLYMSPAELGQSLADGISDIRDLSGHDPTLIRPPYWSYDARTLTAYHAYGLNMLLTDINARDGSIWGWSISLRRGSQFRAKLAEVRRSIEKDRLPVVDGVVPVVLTFHDTSDFTAGHMEEYLRIIVEESRRVGLTLASEPFYNDGATIERVARLRAEIGVYATE